MIRTVNIAEKNNYFYVVLIGESFSKSRVFRTLLAAQKHTKRLLLKAGTILRKGSLPIE